MSEHPSPAGSRLWTVLLVALALVFPVGAVLQPWLWPSRSHLPIVARQLHEPILLLTVPGLRADRVHHLGYPKDTTPVLDRLAHEGISLPWFFANGNDANVTLGAIFTGNCPVANGLTDAAGKLPYNTDTLARQLFDNGYYSIAVAADRKLADRGLLRGFNKTEVIPQARATKVLDTALELLRGAPRENVFLWADLSNLLPPYGTTAVDIRKFAPDAPRGFGDKAADYDLDAERLAERGWGPREIGWLSARYDAALFELDEAIGNFLDQLREAGDLDSMTLCITGTRGERLDENPTRTFARSCDLTDASLHVPFLLRLPGAIYRGLQPDLLAQSTDIAATLTDLAADRPWETPVGQSLRPLILNGKRLNPSVFAVGNVQEARGQPAWRGFVQRLETLKVLFDETGAVRGAWRIADDPQELQPVELTETRLISVRDAMGNWPVTCLPF